MRVPSDELLGDRPQRIRYREPPGIRLYLRKEDPLEDQIADLAAERVVISAIDRVEYFVRLLEHESSQRFNRLLVLFYVLRDAALGTIIPSVRIEGVTGGDKPAAVYDLTQKNVSVTTTNADNVSITSQTGEVKVKGLELEAVSDVTDNLKVIAAYTLAKSEVQKGDFKGNRLQLMPNQQASLWADYTWHNGVLDGFGIGAGARYTGNTYGDQGNTWLGKADAYTVFDAAVHYDLGRLDNSLKGASLALNATNLFDKDYISTCDSFYCYYGDQRSVVASATYKW